MPWNTIIVRGEPHASPGPGGSAPPEHRPLARREAAYLHARHPRGMCHETTVHIEFPGIARADPHGRPILSGVVPVRVTLDDSDAQSMVNQRFELALFEDLTFLFEEENGANPFTYLWNTAQVPPGEHLLTVNILGYEDHYGVETRPVLIEAAK